MKLFLFSAAFCFCCITTFSQKRTTQFSIAGEGAVMATEQAYMVYNAGFGGSGKVLYPIGKKNYLTGTFEVMAFSGRSGRLLEVLGRTDAEIEILANNISDPYIRAAFLYQMKNTNAAHPPLTLFVPKIGYKYFFNNKLNTEVEVGYCIAKVKKLYESIPGDIGGYDFSIGAGFLVTKKLDIGLRYEQFQSTASTKDFTSFLALRTLLTIDFK